MSAIVAPAPRAGRREWIGLAVIALPCMLYSMNAGASCAITMMVHAVPEPK